MATNAGVIILSRRTIKGERLQIEDNIGEGIHIHYRNFRLDYTIKDMLRFSDACEQALNNLGYTIKTNDEQ